MKLNDDMNDSKSNQIRLSSGLTNPRERGTGHNTADELETVKNSMI